MANLNASAGVQGEVNGSNSTWVEITNISSVLDFKSLEELFTCCGKIRTLDLRRRFTGGRICFIEFSLPAEAAAAEFLKNTQLGDQRVMVRRLSLSEVTEAKRMTQEIENCKKDQGIVEHAVKKLQKFSEIQDTVEQAIRDDELQRTIYCGNLGPQVSEEHIKSIFKSCGRVLFVKIQSPRSEHNPLGSQYAFIEFETVDGAKKAFALNGLMLGERGLKLGKATNPIYKTGTGLRSRAVPPHKIKDAMNLVDIAVGRLSKRITSRARNGSRDRYEDEKLSEERKRKEERWMKTKSVSPPPRRDERMMSPRDRGYASRKRSYSRSRSRTRGRIRRGSRSYERKDIRSSRSRDYRDQRSMNRRRSPSYENASSRYGDQSRRPARRSRSPRGGGRSLRSPYNSKRRSISPRPRQQ